MKHRITPEGPTVSEAVENYKEVKLRNQELEILLEKKDDIIFAVNQEVAQCEYEMTVLRTKINYIAGMSFLYGLAGSAIVLLGFFVGSILFN